MTQEVVNIDPLLLDKTSSNEEIGAALRSQLGFIQRAIKSERERWDMVRQLHGGDLSTD